MERPKMCLLDDTKECNDCGECDRCDLDPSKLCDNCCKCLMDDHDDEFRSVIVKQDDQPAAKRGRVPSAAELNEEQQDDSFAPLEVDPKLAEYWEKILIEHGEAPADDGLGETETTTLHSVARKRHK